jgi:hypothetical protein
MTVYNKFIYDQATFGVTGKSLKKLCNAITDNIKDKVLVVEIPTDDILCGFLLLNQTNGSATWSGDGFRTDGGGEGGRGYRAAHKLLDTFGVRLFNVYSEEIIVLFKEATNNHSSDAIQAQTFLKGVRKVAEEFDEFEFQCVYETIPNY